MAKPLRIRKSRTPEVQPSEYMDSIDPYEFLPHRKVSRDRWRNGNDPELRLTLQQQIDLLRRAKKIFTSPRTDVLFEDLLKIIFAHPKEKVLRYIAFWVVRDVISIRELARRLRCTSTRARHLAKVVQDRIWSYIATYDLDHAVRDGLRGLSDEDLLEHEKLEQDIREIIRG